MKKADVTKLLNQGFSERLKPLKFRKCQYGFVKDYSDFFITLKYSSSSYDTVFPSSFYCGLGLKKILNVLKKMSPDLMMHPSNQYPSNFMLHQVQMFSNNQYPLMKYEISTEADAQNMVSEVSVFFLEKVVPYFESIANLESIEKLTQEAPPLPTGGGNALLLAKLAGNPEYGNIKSFYRNLLVEKNMIQTIRDDFEKDVKFIESYTCEELLAMADTP